MWMRIGRVECHASRANISKSLSWDTRYIPEAVYQKLFVSILFRIQFTFYASFIHSCTYALMDHFALSQPSIYSV